jgi:hypothetical protein
VRRGRPILSLSFFLLGGVAIPFANSQETPAVPVKVVQPTGLPKVKDNTKGTLAIRDGKLHFVHRMDTWT